MSSSRRNSLLLALASIGVAYLFFRAESFWGIVCSALVAVWALITMLPVMDAGWRSKVGFVTCVALVTGLVLWPLADSMSGGKIACPSYVRDNIDFGIAPGLDLRGGMRLVYTVEVEEAIRDKRDHFAEDMRHDLAVAYGFQSGDGIMSRETLAKLEEKLHVSTPVADSAQIRIKFTDAGDIAGKIDERFRNKFLREMGQQANPDPAELVFKIKAEEETKVRERAVAQAKDTVGRRVDELGLREASVTVRDEDIIIEVPGQDQKAFEEIKEIIRKTARLEFKMVDDETDFFAKVKDSELPEGEGLSIWQENAPAGPKRTVQTHYARMIKRDNESMLECKERFKAWVRGLNVPDDHQVGYERVLETDEDTLTQTETGWRTLYLFARADVTGDYITDASVPPPDTSNGGSQYYVALAFSPTGADRFEEVTGANVGRRFAIILDEVIDSAPRIQTKIAGGRATITMGGGDARQQLENAKKLELVLRSGALPAPITPSNETLI
ncbi:protein translocase subunit SecD, partial [bacterium]